MAVIFSAPKISSVTDGIAETHRRQRVTAFPGAPCGVDWWRYGQAASFA